MQRRTIGGVISGQCNASGGAYAGGRCPALFQMLGVFSEFEREMITERVNAGIKRAKAALIGGASVRASAKLTGVSVGTVASVRRDLAEAGAF